MTDVEIIRLDELPLSNIAREFVGADKGLGYLLLVTNSNMQTSLMFATIVALTIATLKAVLVVLFFMHLKYTSEKMTSVVVISALFWLLILLALSLADYSTRPLGVS